MTESREVGCSVAITGGAVVLVLLTFAAIALYT